MNKTLLGICLLIISVSAFFMWVNPHYGNVKVLKSQLADSTLALSRAQQLNVIRSQLMDQQNSLASSDLAKLQKLLPNSVDSVRFVINMQSIASRSGLAIQDIGINSDSNSASQSSALGTLGKQYGETDLSFSVSATYENLIAFLNDLERSLQVIEVKSLAFSVDDKSPNVYKVSMTVGTFWLNQSSSSVTSP